MYKQPLRLNNFCCWNCGTKTDMLFKTIDKSDVSRASCPVCNSTNIFVYDKQRKREYKLNEHGADKNY